MRKLPSITWTYKVLNNVPSVTVSLDEPEYEEIGTSELLEGDVVTHFEQDGRWVALWAPATVIDDNEHEAKCQYLNDGGECYLVHKFSTRYRVRLNKQVAEEPKSDRWNGTCTRCGRGTYTGFTSIEHDGPCR